LHRAATGLDVDDQEIACVHGRRIPCVRCDRA
jgi:hypothetical protein